MENEEKAEEINQEKVTIQYICPAVPKINMENPDDETYQLVLLKIGIESMNSGTCPLII